jgi:tRNA/rRNA methyltransferase
MDQWNKYAFSPDSRLARAARKYRRCGACHENHGIQSAAHRCQWRLAGSGEILDNVQTFATLADALADIDFSVATTARSRAKFRYYATPEQVETQLLEKRQWVNSMALVFGREDSGLTNEELELVDLLTGIPMANDYPSLNLGQAVMVYCYQLSKLNQVEAPVAPAADGQQLQALRQRFHQLLAQLEVSDDEKLSDWIDQRVGLLEQRDSAMLHRLLHDIEKKLTDKSSAKSWFYSNRSQGISASQTIEHHFTVSPVPVRSGWNLSAGQIGLT